MQLKYSYQAQFDLENIAFEGDIRFGEARTDLYLKSIDETAKIIQSFPEIGKIPFPDLDPDTRALRSGMHIIYYEVTETEILVNAIIHARANSQEILASRQNTKAPK
ncbi:type II toxin-antitoxin system RelE/ParE family toxin [Litorimonas sp.]|uniref:type II toxin-antitoxin system RelE/ParE family toxin n=1 Tax=Litorimonas sp. TaxID=1892381 RepID=UPI003A83CEA2